MSFVYFYTPIGEMGVGVEEERITRIFLPGEIPQQREVAQETPLHRKAIEQIREYLAGKRQVFDLPLAAKGTQFQEKVWQALQQIPYGQKTSYQEIACMIGNPKACRAVGSANRSNPIPLIIPCHRVIGKDGSLTGFGGGLPLKEWLINMEENHVEM